MEVEIIEKGKESVELKIDSMTVAEILRAYLNKQGVKFVAWRKEHPSKPLIFRIDSSGKSVKKLVSEAVSAIKKDCNQVLFNLKK